MVGLLWTSNQLVAKVGIYKTTNNHRRLKSITPEGFELAISRFKRLQTYALDWTATGICFHFVYVKFITHKLNVTTHQNIFNCYIINNI
jgi:hypothetical protein